ncbi:MAG: transporter [Bacteroides sp.]|nr:transporter [Bacteroides sp.]MCM1085610.1 transporter [Bacteroides sp.]
MKRKAFILSLILSAAACRAPAWAQCCGAGNPISSANGETAVRKGNLLVALDYRHSESNRYYEGSRVSNYDFPGKIKGAGYDFMTFGVGYGIVSWLTAQVQLGYYINKYERYNSDLFQDVAVNGIGDLSLSLDFTAYRSVGKGITVNPYIMVKFPVGKFDCEKDGVKLPISMQPSSGSYKYTAGVYLAWSPLRKFYFTTNDFFEYAQRIKSRNFDYQYGSLLYLNVAGFYRVIKQLDVGVMMAYETKGRAKSDNQPLVGTVYHQIKLIPSVAYRPIKSLTLSILADIPVWRKVEAMQIANTWAIEAKITYNIKINKS